jgi:hypothetical protein
VGAPAVQYSRVDTVKTDVGRNQDRQADVVAVRAARTGIGLALESRIWHLQQIDAPP